MTPKLELLAKAISDADFVLSVKRAREEDTGDEYEALAQGAVEALTAAGYSIIHDSENHGPTVERAGEWHEAEAKRLGPDSAFSRLHRSCASAIRAMEVKP